MGILKTARKSCAHSVTVIANCADGKKGFVERVIVSFYIAGATFSHALCAHQAIVHHGIKVYFYGADAIAERRASNVDANRSRVETTNVRRGTMRAIIGNKSIKSINSRVCVARAQHKSYVYKPNMYTKCLPCPQDFMASELLHWIMPAFMVVVEVCLFMI